MQKVFASESIYIGRSQKKDAGRGVFAKTRINKGEVVEKSPFIEIDKSDPANLKGSLLVGYFFYYGDEKEKSALALGFGSLYNHSDNPNVTYKVESEKELIEFVALKDIKRDEELTINYKGEKEKFPLWFRDKS